MKNIWDKVKGLATPYAADDDYDDEYDDEMDDGFAEDEAASHFSSRSSRRERRAAPSMTEDSAFETTESADSASSLSGLSSSSFSSSVSTGFTGHVMGGSASSNKQQLVLVRPETFGDATSISANLLEKRAVVLNLDNVDKALARRVVDFLSGCTFAVGGSVKKVAHATYLFCPSNMEITGELQNLAGETEAYV